MKKILILSSLMSSILILFFNVQLTFAQTTPTPSASSCPAGQVYSPDLNICIAQDPVGFVEQFYGIGLGILGFVVVIFFIIGGYHLITSQGDPQKLNTGKSFIVYAIMGTLLAIFGFVFVQFVAGTLKIPGFS